MRKKPPPLTPLKDILPEALKTWSHRPKDLVTIIRERWVAVVGPSLATLTTPVKLERELLVIGVQSSPLANELQLLQEKILENLRREVPAASLTRLRFQMLTRSSALKG